MLRYDRLLKLLDDNGYNSYKIKTTGLMGQATYQAIKTGKGGLNHASIDKLCRTFQCQPNDLMEWVPDNPREQ